MIPRYFILIAAFPILVTFSGFVAGVEQPISWFFRLLCIWAGLGFIFSLFQSGLSQGRVDRVLFIILISALIQGLVGIAQLWLTTDMPFFLPSSSSGRPYGLFQQINNQASYQATALIISAYLIARPYIFTRGYLKKIIILITILVASYVLTVSNSRIGVLTVFLGLLLIISAFWRNYAKNKKQALAAIVMIVVGFGLGQKEANNLIIDKTVALQSGYSGSARLSIYSVSLDLVKQEPIFGHGIGSFGRVFQYQLPTFYSKNPDAILPYEYVAHPHNEIFLWLVEGGIVAGLGLLCIVAWLVLILSKLGWHRGGAYVAMLFPITAHTLAELPLYQSALHWFLLLFLLFISGSHLLYEKELH